jgi:hypothetical protein
MAGTAIAELRHFPKDFSITTGEGVNAHLVGKNTIVQMTRTIEHAELSPFTLGHCG